MRVTLVRALALLTAVALVSACRRGDARADELRHGTAQASESGNRRLATLHDSARAAAHRIAGARHAFDSMSRIRYTVAPSGMRGFASARSWNGWRRRDRASTTTRIWCLCVGTAIAHHLRCVSRARAKHSRPRDRDAAATWEQLTVRTGVGHRRPLPGVGTVRQIRWHRTAVALRCRGDRGVACRSGRPREDLPVPAPASPEATACFMGKCINCHRVNGAGGALASELNTPANVTEYWNPLALRQFILNPASIPRGVEDAQADWPDRA